MEEAIRDPHAAASMSALFEASSRKLVNDAEVAEVDDRDQDAVKYLSFSKGLMDGFYGEVFTNTEQRLGNEAQEWADEVTSSRESLVRAAAGLATGTEAADLAKEKGQEVATGILEGWVRQTVMATPGEAPKNLVEGLKGLQDAEVSTTWWSTFATHAAALASTDDALRSIRPVTLRLPGHAAARTYSGDPYGRARGSIRYVTGPADDFVSVMRKYGGQDAVAKMNPRQLDAYSRWAQDPAVVGRLAGRGAFDSLLGRDVTREPSSLGHDLP
jgi:hypothetical protein